MQNKVIINFLSTDEKKAQYTAACKDLGISISEVCRRALDNTVALSEKLKSSKTSETQEQEAHQ
jgi:antitoxin component of RelBE/YafQ-DinJ toxin-antitoxin module